MDFLTTYTGESVSPLTPNANQIHIKDIAHALSLICRANGHLAHFYSVAQHCINCANEAKARGLSERVQLACLLHDGSEAYLSDITRPVKKNLPGYLEIEKPLQDMIYKKFLGYPLSEDESALVKQVDDDMLICELNALMSKKVFGRNPHIESKPSFRFTSFAAVEREYVDIINKGTAEPPDKTLKYRDSMRLGALRELTAAKLFMEQGFTVSTPNLDARYDLITEKYPQLKRVQVKPLIFKSGNMWCIRPYSNPGKNKRTYELKDCDVVVGICLDTGNFAIVPVDKVAGRTEFRLSEHEDGNGNEYLNSFKAIE